MKDIKTLINMIKQIGCIMTKRQILNMFGVFVLISIGAALQLISVSIILPFVQAIVSPEQLLQKMYIKKLMFFFHLSGYEEMLIMVGIGIICIYVLKNICLMLTDYIQTIYSCKMQKELSTLMFDSYLSRTYSFFTNTDSGEIIRGINDDASQVFIVLQYFFKFLSEILTILAISIYLLYIDNSMAMGLMFIAVVTFLLIVFVIKRKISSAGKECREANANTISWSIQTIEGIKDVLVFDKRKYVVSKYKRLYDRLTKANITYNFLLMTPDRIIEAFCVSGIIVIVMIRLWCGTNIVSLVPTFSAFAVAAFKLMPCISHATGYVSVFIYSRPFVESAYKNVTEAKKSMNKLDKKYQNELSDKKKIHFKNKIQLNSISWKYADGHKKILDKLSMEIKEGETIGIVGESGSGKSTLADILLGLYHPQEGNIKVDDVNIDDITNSWKKCLGYVPQSVFLLNDTIRENITFGEDTISDELVWQSLDKANLLEYVKGLPKQLDTMVGERGVKFSGGQRQRIAIARALYRQPEVLILDEATSALDNETEKAVMDSISKLQGSITMVIIAHRLTTIEKCDRIYEIKNGRACDETEKYKK